MSLVIGKVTPQEFAKYPLLPPPKGVRSDFENAPNRNASVFVVDSIALAIMVAFFLNRIYTKHFIVRKYSWDDRESNPPAC